MTRTFEENGKLIDEIIVPGKPPVDYRAPVAEVPYQDYDISSAADNQPAVYVRWGMGPTDSTVTYPGWNLDDVEIVGTDRGWCMINDGSDTNLKVVFPIGVAVPLVGIHVSMTGISSCESQPPDLYPVLRLRSAADMN